MIDTLWGLGLAAAAFFGVHLIPVVPGLRARLIARLTRNGYRGLFSVLSIAAFGWLIVAHRGPYDELWSVGPWARLIPLAVLPLALCLLILVYAAPAEAKKIVRHPMLTAVLLWALAHIVPNGDAGSLILFGSAALYALLDMPLNDSRVRREEPAVWAERARTTSLMPFVALVQGRAGALDMRRVALRGALPAVIVYLVILFAHEFVFGLSALP
jgi:uncharacterized membrane protein